MKSQAVRVSLICLAITCGMFATASGHTPDTKLDFKGLLYESLFSYAAPVFKVSDLDPQAYAALSRNLQSRLIEYEDRGRKFLSRRKQPSSKRFPLDEVLDKQQRMEHAIVSLINAPEIEDLAARYASRAALFYEWEGMSNGPLREAEDAEEYLEKNPKTALRPFLLLFLLHRYRCGYECLIWEKNKDDAGEVAKKYHSCLKLARGYPDPLVGLIADDLDGQLKNIYLDPEHTVKNVHP